MRISGTLRGVSDANSRKVQLNQNQMIMEGSHNEQL